MSVNCFSNVCTHRGNILVDKHSVISNSVCCRYHGRKFDSLGKCIFMPKFENVVGFPSKKDEDWKFIDLNKIISSKIPKIKFSNNLVSKKIENKEIFNNISK